MTSDFMNRPHLVGRYRNAHGVEFLPLSESEMLRLNWFYRRVFDTFNLPPRCNVVLISNFEDSAITAALERQLNQDSHIACYVEAVSFDAARLVAFIKRMDIPVIMGVNSDILTGLQSLGQHPADVFAGKIVFARGEDAYQQLQGLPADVRLYRWMEIGPAVAMECSAGGGLHLDSDEWEVSLDGDEVLLSSRKARALDFSSEATGIRATLVTAPCTCGLEGVRILPKL
jgi:hypothetical protein